MTLRKRLTLWSAGLLTLLIILLGSVIYGVMHWTMIASIDATLEETINLVEANSKFVVIPVFGGASRVEIDLPKLDFFRASGVEVQVWKLDNNIWKLADSSANLAQYTSSMDPSALGTRTPKVYKNVNLAGATWRVRTSPMMDAQGQFVGNIQVAGSLEMVNRATKELLTVMLISCALTIAGSALLSMWLAKRLIQPIEDITFAAARVATTKDLATRLKWQGPMDEIGHLTSVFNHMMARLEHLFTVQQRFVADVSHELRTPLTAISGNLDLIKRYGMDPDSLEAITDETERMKRLVNDLLLLARADYGALTVELTPIELDSVLLDVFRQGRGLTQNRQLELKIRHIEPLKINGNIDRLKQMLLNLLDNALKFTPDGGSITLSLHRNVNEAVIEVVDTGAGIAPDDLSRIFDRFYQSDPSRTHSSSAGFGLGLSIAHWIVTAHNGNIIVSSELDKGTTFTIKFPLYIVEAQPDPSHTEVTRTRLPTLRRNRDAEKVQ
ncbi:MAG: HAMP domain-containing histidine kinase [Anaerolineae bacterium]|nr:HAMP domain-containing histidine kinase [Anaerolineae bacterium]